MQKKALQTNRTNSPPRRRRPRQQKRLPPRETPSDSASNGLTKLITGFYTFRTTLKEFSESLQRMEKIMDNAYQMFEMATQFMNQKQSIPGRPPLRLVQPRREEEEEDEEVIPRLNLPSLDGNPDSDTPSSSPPFQNFDFTQLLKILQLPFVRRLMSDLMQAGPRQKGTPRKRKQG
ncbi:hypothetical protein GCM10007416_09770 [Kroppenstedtia guangzhouensis]|uniref:YqfQ-like protein n=1 Tax=Kroppenstedtia guangzhouensis TaxID=1274356 RepID=A0ABQ1G8J7_9BACL|nr:hypothetical protein [Kroppenstedtia guangzhouensis]GGA38847.1 hypothetical protein GCM10007416_09770 [Kroppenstedtia guangzhouensis]